METALTEICLLYTSQPRDDGEAEVRGAERFIGRARRAEQRRNARAGRAVHAHDAVRNERAILTAHRHQVGHLSLIHI